MTKIFLAFYVKNEWKEFHKSLDSVIFYCKLMLISFWFKSHNRWRCYEAFFYSFCNGGIRKTNAWIFIKHPIQLVLRIIWCWLHFRMHLLKASVSALFIVIAITLSQTVSPWYKTVFFSFLEHVRRHHYALFSTISAIDIFQELMHELPPKFRFRKSLR